jgi:hypothetical protein
MGARSEDPSLQELEGVTVLEDILKVLKSVSLRTVVVVS